MLRAQMTLWTHQHALRARSIALLTLCQHKILGLACPERTVPELNERMLCGTLDLKLDNGTKHASTQWLASSGSRSDRSLQFSRHLHVEPCT